MTKITSNIRSSLDSAIVGLALRVTSRRQCSMDARKILEMSIPRDDLQVLQRAAEILGQGDTKYAQVGVDLAPLVQLPSGVRFVQSVALVNLLSNYPLGMAVPQRVNLALGRGTETFNTLQAFIQDRVAISVQVAMARLLVQHFFDRSRSLEQLRFAMPMTLALCKNDDYLEKYVDRLQDYKPPKVLPAMPPHMREVCRAAGDVLGVASMFEGVETRVPLALTFQSLGIIQVEGLGHMELVT